MNWYDRELEQIERDYSSGLISAEEYSRQLHELEREYRACAEEAAQEAYRRELDNW